MSVGLLDTSVVIDLGLIDPAELPDELAITAITLGELSVGPLIARTVSERSRRLQVLQVVEHEFAQAVFPYDSAAARAFGGVMAAALERGRTSRARVSDFQIAAIAIANRLPLYTSNVADFEGIEGLDLHAVTPPPGN